MGEDRRAQVLRVAAEVVARRGVDRVRLRDVASAAGVSIGLLQHYFETRDALVREAFELAALESLQRRIAVPGGTPWERVKAVLDDVIAVEDAEGEAASWLGLCAAAVRHPELRPTVAQVQDGWRGLIRAAIEDGVRDGSLRPALEAADVAAAINALLDGAAVALAAEGADRARVAGELERAAAALAGYSRARSSSAVNDAL